MDAELMGLASKWRAENGDYPESKRDCADELESALSVAQGQGFVMVPVKYATDAQKKIGWTLDIDWVCGLEPKDAEYWPGLEEAEAVILAMLAAAPAQPDGVK